MHYDAKTTVYDQAENMFFMNKDDHVAAIKNDGIGVYREWSCYLAKVFINGYTKIGVIKKW